MTCDAERRILLAVGIPQHYTSKTCNCFVQVNTNWSDDSWEEGFQYETDDLQKNAPQALSVSEERMSDCNRQCTEKRVFSVSWDRDSTASTGAQYAAADTILGHLRTSIPALVVRSGCLNLQTQA